MVIHNEEQFNSFFDVDEHIYIYGCGHFAELLISMLSPTKKSRIKGVILSKKTEERSVWNGINIFSLDEIQLKRDDVILITTGYKMRNEIIKNLTSISFCNYSYVSRNYEEKLWDRLNLKNHFSEMLWRVTAHPIMKNLVVNVTDHCNLRCAGCDHFSSIARERNVTYERLYSDLSRLKHLLDNRIGNLRIMGGEPLLNPELENMIAMSADLFKSSTIEIFTNGILLMKQTDKFWKLLRENNVVLQVTKYPINIDYTEIEKKATYENVKLNYYGGGETVKTLYHIPLNLNGNGDCTYNFMNCTHAQECTMLSEGRLFPCTVAPNIHIFNEKFGYNIPVTEYDGIDIYKIENGQDLLIQLAKPMPLCRFCNIKGRTFGHTWHRTAEDIKEWSD